MALGEIYRFTRRVNIDGVLTVTVMHFNDTVGTSQTPETDILDAWDNGNLGNCETAFGNAQRGFTSYSKLDISCQRISPTKGEIFTTSITQPDPTATDSGLPTFAQVKIDQTTERTDRSGRGGNYIAGVAEAWTNGNVVNAIGLNEYDALIDALAEWWTENGAQFLGYVIGVWSQKLLEFNATTAFSVAGSAGTMVSRRLGNGA